MRFTVLNYGANDAGKAQWAVVLDHEHVMFVGSYQQCEEWLDHHDLLSALDSDASEGRRGDGGLGSRFASWFSSILSWRQQRSGSSNAQPASSVGNTDTKSFSAKQAVLSFLRGTAGHAEALEVIAVALLVCLTGAATASVSTAIRWERALTYSTLATAQRCPRNATVHTTNCCDQIDIACDLGRSDH